MKKLSPLFRVLRWAFSLALCVGVIYGIHTYADYQIKKLRLQNEFQVDVEVLQQVQENGLAQINTLHGTIAELKAEIKELKAENKKVNDELISLTKKLADQSEPVVGITPLPDSENLKTSAPKLNCPENASAKDNKCACDSGYAWSLDKAYCVAIPANAHAVVSKTDVWLCDQGYVEIEETCVRADFVR